MATNSQRCEGAGRLDWYVKKSFLDMNCPYYAGEKGITLYRHVKDYLVEG